MSQFISVFDMLKIGVGPSSSHTLGPWRAAEQWILQLKENNNFEIDENIENKILITVAPDGYLKRVR